MTKGLVRANNLADLSSKQDSIVNLGLAIADYDSLKSLYATAGLDFSIIGGIAGSTGSYQAQIDGISSTLSGIVLSGFVNRQGNSSINTSWTNSDGIISVSGVLSGYSPSSGTTFALSIEQGEAVITASGLSANDLAYNSFRQANSTVVRASPPSGFNTLQLIPLQVGGQSFFVQASETPSFHIAPARMRHALDLVTGNLLGTYNSASPAWAVGPDGVLALPAANAPVIEYDPTTLQCLGARIWGAVTNLFTYSSTFTNSVWSKSNVTIIANSATSPAGTTDASLVVPTTSGFQNRNFQQAYTTSTAGTYTFSIYVNKNTVSTSGIALRITNQTGTSDVRATWNTSTFVFGSVGTVGGWTGSTSVQNLSNGWFRLSISATTTASSHTALLSQFWPGGYTGSSETMGSPLVWGAQFQAGDIGPYVPTTTSAASSTADAWSITGADFSRICNPSATTIYLDALGFAPGGRVYFDDGSGTIERFDLRFSSGPNWCMFSSGGGVNDGLANSNNSNPTVRAAGAIAPDALAISVNGATVVTDTTFTMPQNITQMWIGSFRGASNFANGYIRELAIFRSRRPNANLQAMTQ